MHGDRLAIDLQLGRRFGKIAANVIDQQIGQLLLFTAAPHASQGLLHSGHCSASSIFPMSASMFMALADIAENLSSSSKSKMFDLAFAVNAFI